MPTLISQSVEILVYPSLRREGNVPVYRLLNVFRTVMVLCTARRRPSECKQVSLRSRRRQQPKHVEQGSSSLS